MEKIDFSHNLEDFNLESQIYHEVERKALELLKERFKKEKGLTDDELLNDAIFSGVTDFKKYFENIYSIAEVDKVYREVEEQLRKDYINRMKFTQLYKDQRHIGDLKQAERDMDISYAVGMQKNMDGVFRAGTTVSDDISKINMEKIIDAYINLSAKYNVQDSELLRLIMAKTMLKPQQGILVDEFSKLIKDENEKSDFLKNFKDSPKEFDEFANPLFLGSTDPIAKTNAIREKIVALEYFSEKFPQLMKNYHGSTIKELEESIIRVQSGMEIPESIVINKAVDTENQELLEEPAKSK